jgi:hypothetical protein
VKIKDIEFFRIFFLLADDNGICVWHYVLITNVIPTQKIRIWLITIGHILKRSMNFGVEEI